MKNHSLRFAIMVCAAIGSAFAVAACAAEEPGEPEPRIASVVQAVASASAIWEMPTLNPRPPMQYRAPMVYDSNRRRVVMVGMPVINPGEAETWLYDGSSWTQAVVPTFLPHYDNFIAAHDSVRGRTVLFGGVASPTAQPGKTYEWDGTDWSDRAPATSPIVLNGGAMAFDVTRRKTVMFGRNGLSGVMETWEWDGTDWLKITTTKAPSQRTNASLIYDAGRNRSVLFGGYAGDGYSDETWEYDGTNWTRRAPSTTPEGRITASFAYDFARRRSILFGGQGLTANGFNDTWEWDGTTWTEVMPIRRPRPRTGAGAAFDFHRGRMVIFGGTIFDLTFDSTDETWEYHQRGAACTSAGECDTGRCVDGVCCETACGTCQACDVTPGECTVVLDTADPDSCSGTKSCDSSGACVLVNGQPCTSGSQCLSSHCVDGFCCNSACASPCDVCAITLGAVQNGTCAPARAGYVGSPACVATFCTGTAVTCPTTCTSQANCAAGYFCSSAGRCEPARSNGAGCNTGAGGDCLTAGCSVCGSGFCVDGYCCNTACSSACDRCDVQPGVCAPATAGFAGQPACGVYLCDGSSASCPASCDGNEDCAGSAHCRSGTCQSDVALGAACTSATQCVSGFCVDGVCCDTACTGVCRACSAALKQAGTDGTCGSAKDGQDPHGDCPDQGAISCGTDGACDGAGKCRFYAPGAPCGATGCDGNLVKGQVCNGLGGCAPSTAGVDCAPYVCAASLGRCANPCTGDAECTSGNFCNEGACTAKLALGIVCSSPTQCASGFCVEGVCCDTACTGVCQACAAVNKQSGTDAGTCGPAKAGLDPHDTCPDDGSISCNRDGTCDGLGGCRQYAAGTVCGATSCVNNVQTGYACNGSGACITDMTVDCGSFLCGGSACLTTCASSNDCKSDAWCDSGTCKPKLSDGQTCTVRDECNTGICVDGVCCASPCQGQCEACDVAGAEGTCAPVTGTPHGARDTCSEGTATDPCLEASCNGVDRTRCAAFVGSSTTCRVAACSAGVATLAAGCDGKGACAPLETKACEPFACSAEACATSCASDTDCARGYRCRDGSCQVSGVCDGEHTVTSPTGAEQNCSPLRCSVAEGRCLERCEATSDCVASYVCAADGKCVSTGGEQVQDEGCGCKIASTRRPSPSVIAFALLLAVARRRQRKAGGK